MNIISALENTIPISVFNRGLAGKVFSEVKQSGTKVVIKNNIPECVLISPKEYLELIEEVENARLISLANQRLQNYNPDTVVSFEDMKAQLDIADDELEQMDEVDIE